MALVEISQKEGRVPVTVFQLQDRVNLGNYAELEETAKNAYENGMRDLVIDLSKTPSLTSIGVRALVVIHRMLATDAGAKHLKLAGPIPYIREMLDVSGVTQYIDIYDTVDEAVASF
ncbi:MAG TPA: STAS domain-containing protein [Anaerolineales bacterium]